jgi:hypothetical protein
MWVLVLKIAMHFGAWPLGLDIVHSQKGFNMFKVQRLIFPRSAWHVVPFRLVGERKYQRDIIS